MKYKSRLSRGLKPRSLLGRSRRTKARRKPMTSGRVKRIIDAELKVRDLGVGYIAIPTITGSVVHISNIAQGDLFNQRTGNWIKPTTFMGTVTIRGNATADASFTPQFRVGLVCWKENQDLNPLTLAKIMQDTAAPHQQYNVQNKGQFKILWSRTGILSNQEDNPQYLKVLRFYVKPSLKLLYDGADFKNNHLFVFAYSDVATAVNPPAYAFDVRLRYTDS